jgi:hypothetical protein
MSFFPTNANQVQAFAGAMYGTQIGSVTMAQVNADIAAAGGLKNALNSYYTASFGSLPTASVAATVAANLGLTGDALASGAAYITAQLNGVAAGARGALISDIVNLFSTLAADATFGAAATAWNTKVAAAVAYTGAANAAAGTVVAEAAKVFTLTNSLNPNTGGADDVQGTAANDRINGVVDMSGGTVSSFTAGDIINGGEGIDSMSLTLVNAAAANAQMGGIVTGVETINLANAASNGLNAPALDLTNTTGAKTVNLTTSQDGVVLTVSGLKNIVDAGLSGNGGLTMDYATTATAGTADVQNVSLNGITRALSTSTSNTFTANGIETLNVTGVAASRVNLAGTSLKTINVDGAASTIVITAEPTVTTIDASKATGNVTMVATAATSVTKLVGGSGDDGITFGGTLTRNISVDGGEGKDKLSLGNTAFATDAFANVKNIETIALNASSAAVTVDVKAVKGLTEVVSSVTQAAADVAGAQAAIVGVLVGLDANLDGVASGAEILAYQEASSGNATNYAGAAGAANASTVGVDNLTSGSTFTLESRGLKALYETDPTAFDLLGQGAVTLNVFQASNAANTADSLNLVIDNNSTYAIKNTALGSSSAAKNLYVVDSVTLPNVETVSINSTGAFGGNMITAANFTGAANIIVSGTQNLTIGTGTGTGGLDVSNTDSVALDASALTGRLAVQVTATELANFSGGIKGGSGADTLTALLQADTQIIDATTTSIESVLARVSADVTGTVDFGGFAGATTTRVTLTAGAAGGDVVTIQGLANGSTLQLQGTQTNDSLAIQGAGSGSSLKLDFSQDTTAGFTTGVVALSRVADLTINTTRADGVDSNLTVAQQATTLGGINSPSLKKITVTGVQDGANVLTLGNLDNTAGASLLESVDLSGFAGSLADSGLALDGTIGSKGVTISLNSATSVGTRELLLVPAVAGITLGAGADTVVLSSSAAGNIVIAAFQGAVGASVSTPVDKINLSAMGVKMSDLTFTDYDTVADAGVLNDSVHIAITGVTGQISLVGVVAASLTEANFIF